ncbi:MAG TPA: type I-E CRISPR-associated protein Cse1/CasA, partial [Sphaerochaeta sp.]|nr:type I-E CRISPR-associated protein Cse1/CasA [Sphaerochaeta sp.]
MNNRFNLVDEPWIPVVDHPRISLFELFSDSTLKAIGGNAIQKLALLKLFLAIAQKAYTPIDDQDWQ